MSVSSLATYPLFSKDDMISIDANIRQLEPRLYT